MAIFDPPQNPHPLTNHQKFGTGDYVDGLYGCTKFGAYPPMGANGWNITHFKKFIPFFGNSPTGQTCRPIFTLDGSNDVDSHKGVPFGDLIDIAPHFGGEVPQKPQFWGPE